MNKINWVSKISVLFPIIMEQLLFFIQAYS
jgi:hypothetical protein